MRLPAFISTLLSRYFRWVAGGVVVVILGLGYWLVLGQQIASVQSTSVAERNQTAQELKAERDYLAALKTSISRFQQALPENQLASIDDFLPSTSDFPGLLLTLKNLAAAANVSLQSLTLSQSGQTGTTSSAASTSASSSSTAANAAVATSLNVRTQDATIAVSGGTSYEDFKRFLSVLERSRRLLDVIQLSFGLGGDSGGSTSSGYNLTVRTYYLPNTK